MAMNFNLELFSKFSIIISATYHVYNDTKKIVNFGGK